MLGVLVILNQDLNTIMQKVLSKQETVFLGKLCIQKNTLICLLLMIGKDILRAVLVEER